MDDKKSEIIDKAFSKIMSRQDFGEKFALSLLFNKQLPNLTETIINDLNEIYHKETYGKIGKPPQYSDTELSLMKKSIQQALEAQGIKIVQSEIMNMPQDLEIEYFSPSKENNIVYHFTNKQKEMDLKDIDLENNSFKKEEALIPLLLLMSNIKDNQIRAFFTDKDFQTKPEVFNQFMINIKDTTNILNSINWNDLPSLNEYFLRANIKHEQPLMFEKLFLPEFHELPWYEQLIREVTFRVWIADETQLTEFFYLKRLNAELQSNKLQNKILDMEKSLDAKMCRIKDKVEKQFEIFSYVINDSSKHDNK